MNCSSRGAGAAGAGRSHLPIGTEGRAFAAEPVLPQGRMVLTKLKEAKARLTKTFTLIPVSRYVPRQQDSCLVTLDAPSFRFVRTIWACGGTGLAGGAPTQWV